MGNKKNIKAFFASFNPTEAQSEKMYKEILSKHQNEKKRSYLTMKKLRPAFKGAIGFATVAAVVCIFMFGGFFNNGGLLPTQTANAFTLTAYAAEQQPDGTVTTGKQLEFNQADKQFITFGGQRILADNGDFLGMYMYMGVAFKCEGANIESVTLSVDEGSFSLINTDNHSYYDIERLGATHTMNKQELANSEILWGYDVPASSIIERSSNPLRVTIDGKDVFVDGKPVFNITIKAVVTFEDGEVQEKTVVYDTAKGVLILNER